MQEGKEDSLEWFRQQCQLHRIVITVQRQAVYEYLLSTKSHPTADQVYEALAPECPALSRTSVYRILDCFARHGLIKRLPHLGTSARYDGDISQHHHTNCMICGQVVDVGFSGVKMEIPQGIQLPEGFQLTDCSIVFTGICRACSLGMGVTDTT